MIRLFVIAAALLLSGSSRAQTPNDLARCRAISDNDQRLSCFDSLVRPPVGREKSDGYQRISLIDLKVDRDHMTSQAVEVDGELMLMGELLMLGQGGLDASPIFVDFKKLPRDQRRRIIECGMNCAATVRGKVGKVMMQQGIIAESITAR